MVCNTHEIVSVEYDERFAYFLCLDCDKVADIEDVYVSDLNGEEVERQGDEFVCLACRTIVPGAGHERWQCEEAGRERAAESTADYRY